MHLIPFSMKRAYQSTLRITRGFAARWGLTPARYDMLVAIARMRLISQVELRYALGVSRTTVSVMVRALEKLGLVTRRKHRFDDRTLDIELTERGAERLRLAEEDLRGSGAIELAVEVFVGPRFGETEACRREQEALYATLRHVRYTLGDTGSLYIAGEGWERGRPIFPSGPIRKGWLSRSPKARAHNRANRAWRLAAWRATAD